MGGGSKKQTVGYKYFAKVAIALGSRIERLCGVNIDDRGFIPLNIGIDNKTGFINKPNLFGSEEEGGVSGGVTVHLGLSNPSADAQYALRCSSLGFPAFKYPFLSYMVLQNNSTGFYFGNTGMMREMRWFPQRVKIKNDGSTQWNIGTSAIYDGSFSSGQPLNRLALILDCSGSMAGDRHNNLRLALSMLKESFDNGMIKPSALKINLFSTTVQSFQGTSNFSTIIDSAISALYASGGTDATMAMSGISSFMANAAKNDVIVILSDGDMTSINEALNQLGSIRYNATIVGVGLETAGSLGSFHNAESPISVITNANAQDMLSLLIDSILSSSLPIYDINIAHKIREILTDARSLNMHESRLNDESFVSAANRLFSEGLGISWCLTDKSCKEALDELSYHMDGGIRVNRQTGLVEIILFRDDLINPVATIDESKIIDKSIELRKANTDVTTGNAVDVSYFDRKNLKSASFPINNIALIKELGQVNSMKVDLNYFMSFDKSLKVASWKLARLSKPCWTGSFKLSLFDSINLNKFDIITLNIPSAKLSGLTVRISDIHIENSDSDIVKIEWEQVISANDPVIVSSFDSGEVIYKEITKAHQFIFEADYYLMERILGQKQLDESLLTYDEFPTCYIAAIASPTTSNAIKGYLKSDNGTGSFENLETVASVDFSASFKLAQDVGYIESTIAIASLKNLDSESLEGKTFLINNREFIYIESYDEDLGVIQVKRGIRDLLPKQHSANDIAICLDDNLGYDPSAFMGGETIQSVVLTSTINDLESLNVGNIKSVNLINRVSRPYPPANIKISDQLWPDVVPQVIQVTWSHRNKKLQIGAGLLDFYNSTSLAVESGLQYELRLYDSDDALLKTITTAETSAILSLVEFSLILNFKLQINSVLNGLYSFDTFEHSFTCNGNGAILKFTTENARPVANNVVLQFKDV